MSARNAQIRRAGALAGARRSDRCRSTRPGPLDPGSTSPEGAPRSGRALGRGTGPRITGPQARGRLSEIPIEDNDFRPCLDRRDHSFRQERSGGHSQPRRPAWPPHESRPVRETVPYGMAEAGDREIDGFAVVRIGFRLGIADGPVRVRVLPYRLHRLIRPDLPRGLTCLDGRLCSIRVALTQGREQDRRPSPFCLHQWRHNGSFCPVRGRQRLIALSSSCNSASAASARIRAPRCFPVRLILTACAHPAPCRLPGPQNRIQRSRSRTMRSFSGELVPRSKS